MMAEKTELHEGLLLLVDVQNLFYTARDAFGVAARVDFKKIKQAALKDRKFRHIHAIAYFATRPGEKPDSFVSALEKLNYEVKLISIKQHEEGQASQTNIDVELANDATTIKVGGKEPEVVVVASGDNDFVPVYKTLKERGTRVEVLAFAASLGAAVENIADEVSLLGRIHLFIDYDNKKDKATVDEVGDEISENKKEITTEAP